MMELLNFWKKFKNKISQQQLSSSYEDRMNLNLMDCDIVDEIIGHSYFNSLPLEEKKNFLNILINLMQDDVQTHYMTEVLKKKYPHVGIESLFPFYFLSPKIEHRLKQEVVLNDKCVVSPTWRTHSLTHLMPRIKKEGYRKDLLETTGFYIPDLNLVFILNGRHRLVASILDGVECTAMLEIFDFSKRPNIVVREVLAHWYWVLLDNDGNEIDRQEVQDVRFVILWKLHKALTELG